MSHRLPSVVRKSAPLPPLAQPTSQIDELYTQHPINSSRGVVFSDYEEDPLIAENKALEAKVTQLTEENQQVAAQNQKIMVQNEDLLKKNTNLETQLKNQANEINELKEKNSKISTDLQNLNLRLNKMPMNAEKTKNENVYLKKQIEELRIELKKKEGQISESMLCLQSQQSQFHEINREKTNVTEKLKKVIAFKQELETKLNLAQNENEKLIYNERNRESILKSVKAEKDKIISDLQEKLTQSNEELEKINKKNTDLSNEISTLNEQLSRYQDMIKKGLKGIEDTPENVEERNCRRKERKEKANELFENFKKMKLQEKELVDKINDIQSEITIEENAAKLESSMNIPKSLKPMNKTSSEEDTEKSPEQQTEETSNTEKIENTENSENKENSNDQESISELDKLKKNCQEVQNDLSDFIQKEEKLKVEMIRFGIKATSFDKIDEPWVEEEDESDFTFTEIKDRVRKLRNLRNNAINQMNIAKEENESLKIDLADNKLRVEKIQEIVKSLISQRVIKQPAPK